ncbi:MAG TPA: hypothetical protein VN804_01600 [Solirubrobacteraceae bacterium]|nr:hypothetical protein [Solirubrobacteraceae bacterium]
MSSRMRKLPLLALALLASVALAACGDSHSKVTTGTYAGESGKNAPYLDVGPLSYEVQLSRELNPYDAEDAQYLQGLTPEQRKLEAGQEWFGVFIQVYNNGSHSEPTATDFTITDTQENVYTPLSLGAVNPFAYRPETIARNSRLPALDTTAANGPTQGALLLFKIQVVSLDNRPLTLKVVDPTDAAETASAELDV